VSPIIPHNNPESMSPFLQRLKQRARDGTSKDTIDRLDTWQNRAVEEQFLSMEERQILRKSLQDERRRFKAN
jgi:hypothetical protein